VTKSVTIGRTWQLWATRHENGALWHVGARRWVELHGSQDPIVAVLVEEILGDDYAPEVTHYGWQDAEDRPLRAGAREYPRMIQVRTGADPERAMMFLRMCFPYGLRAAIDHGDGRVVAMRITEATASSAEDSR